MSRLYHSCCKIGCPENAATGFTVIGCRVNNASVLVTGPTPRWSFHVRRYRPQSDIQKAIDELKACMDQLQQTLDIMRSHKLEELLCHADDMMDRRIPNVLSWAAKMKGEATEQGFAIKAGRASAAEMMLDRAAREAAKAGRPKGGLQQAKRPRAKS